jgi:elongation factor Tu
MLAVAGAVILATGGLAGPGIGNLAERLGSDGQEAPLRMVVTDVFSVQSVGTIVAGTIERGSVSVGDQVDVLGFRFERNFVVTTISVNRERVQTAGAGAFAGLSLRGAERRDLKPGMVVAEPGSVRQHKAVVARITFDAAAFADGDVRPGQRTGRIRVWANQVETLADWFRPDSVESLAPGQPTPIIVDLVDPLAIESGSELLLRRSGRTLARGPITEILF